MNAGRSIGSIFLIANALGIPVRQFDNYGPNPTINEMSSHGQKSIEGMKEKLVRKNYTLDEFTDLNRTSINIMHYDDIAAFMLLAQKHFPEIVGNEIEITGELIHHPKTEYRSNRLNVSHIGGIASEWQLKTQIQSITDDMTHGLYAIERKLDIAKELDWPAKNKLSKQLGHLMGGSIDVSNLTQIEISSIKSAINEVIHEIYLILFSTTNFMKSDLNIRGTIVALGKGKAGNKLDKADPAIAKLMRDRRWQKNDSGIIVPDEVRTENLTKVYNYTGKQQSKLNYCVKKLFDIYVEKLGEYRKKGNVEIDGNRKAKFYSRAYNEAIKQVAETIEGNVDDPMQFIFDNYGDFTNLIDENVVIPIYNKVHGESDKYFKKDFDREYKKLMRTESKTFKDSVLRATRYLKQNTDKDDSNY